MTQLLGYETRGEPSRVYRLEKAIYGLKQFPHAWLTSLVLVIA